MSMAGKKKKAFLTGRKGRYDGLTISCVLMPLPLSCRSNGWFGIKRKEWAQKKVRVFLARFKRSLGGKKNPDKKMIYVQFVLAHWGQLKILLWIVFFLSFFCSYIRVWFSPRVCLYGRPFPPIHMKQRNTMLSQYLYIWRYSKGKTNGKHSSHSD